MKIAAYHGLSLVSRFIRFRTWDDETHVSWVEDDMREFEAWQLAGVNWVHHMGAHHTPGTPVDLYEVDITPGEHEGLIAFFDRQRGKKYDWRGVAGFISRRDRAHEPERWFCSNLIFAAFQEIKKPLLMRIPHWRVSPAMITYSPLLKLSDRVTVVHGGIRSEKIRPDIVGRACACAF